MSHLVFANNSCTSSGSSFTAFHFNFEGRIDHSIFLRNWNTGNAAGTAAYLYSDADWVNLSASLFDSPRSEALLVYFTDTSWIAEVGESPNAYERPLAWDGVSPSRKQLC
jgi:hypothetical protein